MVMKKNVSNDLSDENKLKALKESEEKYSAMFLNAPLSYQSLDEDGKILEMNPMWANTVGYDRKEVIGKWFGDYLHPDYVEHFKNSFIKLKKSGCSNDVQFRMKRKDGRFIYVSFEGRVGLTPEGEFKQTYCVFKDITGQKEVEEELRKTQLLLKSSIESPRDMIILSLDKDYKYLYFNKAHEEGMKRIYNKEVKIGMSLINFVTNGFCSSL